jgi:hypothetical protein
MRRALWFFLGTILVAALAAAQATYPPTQSTPGTNPTVPTGPQSPGNPATTMPPDTAAAPPQTTAPPDAGQQPEPAVSARPSVSTRGEQVNANTEMKATLDTPLSTKTSKVGDRFTATVAEAVRGTSGRVAIPAGAKIQGEVVNVEEGKTLPSVRGKGRLNFRFRDVMLPDGSSLPLTATLVSVNQTRGGKSAGGAKTGEEGEVRGGTTAGRVAKDVGIGAGVGTVAGLIFGSALKGLAIGAIAGGGYVLATSGKDVNLPADTGMVLRLDQNLTVPATSPQRP